MGIFTEQIAKQLKAGITDDQEVDTLSSLLEAMKNSFNGDIIMEISPAATTRDATAAAFTRTVTITFKDSAGNVHTWLTQTFAATLSIGDTSVAGVASLPGGTSLVVVNGVATVVVAGSAAAWLALETNSLTIANVTPAALAKVVTGGTSVETIA